MKHLLLIAALALVVMSCQPPDEFGAPVTPDQLIAVKASTLAGTWRITKVSVVDNDAVDRGFPATSTVTNSPIQRLDITNEFRFSAYRITFNVDGAGNPTTFSVAANGAPNFIGISSGNWSVNDPIFTSQVNFGPAGPTQPSFSVYRAIQGGATTVYLRYSRRNATGNIVLSYEYEFSK